MTDEIKAKFSLDDKEALQKLLNMKGAVQSIGDSKNLDGLAAGMLKVGAVAGTIGAAFFALKGIVENTFEAEAIRSVNVQFEILTKNAGIATETLREGLLKAADGLVDDTDLLKIANQAVVTMGDSAARLPEIMELARKASVLTGGDIADTFESLSNAIARGNTRALKQMGIVVDLDGAYRKYAKSVGIAVDALSDEDKRRALLNETIEKGGKNLKDVDESVLANTRSWQQFQVQVAQLKESIILLVDKAVGPFIKTWLTGLKAIGEDFKTFVDANFGQGVDQIKAKSKQLISDMVAIETEISDLQGKIQRGEPTERGVGWIDELRAKANLLDMELKGLQSQAEVTKTSVTGVTGGATTETPGDKDKLKSQQAAFEKDMVAIQKEALAERLKNILDAGSELQNIRAIQDEQERLMLAEHEAKRNEIISSTRLSGDEHTGQKHAELVDLEIALEEKKKTAILQNEEQIQALVIKSLENQGKAADGFFGKFAAGAALASAKSKKEFMDFSGLGESVTKRMSAGIADSFSHIAEDGFDLGASLKKAIIGALADEAFARGSLLIASSIWPPQPWMTAAGVGLVALSGVLRALSGGGGAASAGAAGGAGGGGRPETKEAAEKESRGQAQLEDRPTPEQHELLRRSVSLTIQGSYFDTEATRLRLTEIIRESADMTDFKVSSVGGGL